MRIFLFFVFPAILWAQTYEITKMGVASKKPSSDVFMKYKPMADYLSRRVYSDLVKGDVKLRIFKSEKELRKAILQKEIYFARLTPQSYIMLKERMPGLGLVAGELLNHQFQNKGILIVQKANFVRNYSHFKSKSFAFGPKTSALLDIVPKSILASKGLKMSDIKPKYLSDIEKIKHFVEVGRVIGGVIPVQALSDDEQDRFRIFSEYSAPGNVWVITKNVFLSTREKIQAELLNTLEPHVSRVLQIDGFVKVNNRDLDEFRSDMRKAMAFHRK
ncbi:MAG: hypothetical protein CR997_03365 [Acidobacteria bacterium]|nr:MAG: hypothetical protein CR997_03365 [Acidobacteriota bacterium]